MQDKSTYHHSYEGKHRADNTRNNGSIHTSSILSRVQSPRKSFENYLYQSDSVIKILRQKEQRRIDNLQRNGETGFKTVGNSQGMSLLKAQAQLRLHDRVGSGGAPLRESNTYLHKSLEAHERSEYRPEPYSRKSKLTQIMRQRKQRNSVQSLRPLNQSLTRLSMAKR